MICSNPRRGGQWRRTLCAAIDRPARSCSAVIKAGKPQGCLPAPFGFWAGAVAGLRPTVRLISPAGTSPPLLLVPRERSRSLGMVEIGLNLRPISTETYIKLR